MHENTAIGALQRGYAAPANVSGAQNNAQAQQTALEAMRMKVSGIQIETAEIEGALRGFLAKLAGERPGKADHPGEPPRAVPNGLLEEIDDFMEAIAASQRRTNEIIFALRGLI